VASVFDNYRRDVAKRDGERSKLLVRKVEEFCFMKGDQGWENGACISEAIWLADVRGSLRGSQP